MPVGAALAATSVGSALIGASAAKNAAKTQATAANDAAQYQLQAAREAMALQLGMFNTIRGDFGPYRGVGTSAIPAYMALLGLPVGPSPANTNAPAPANTGGQLNIPGLNQPVAPMKAGDINWAQVLKDRPDVAEEYNRVLAVADRNSPQFQKLGLDKGPEGFAQWWYFNNRPAGDTYSAPMWTQEQIDELYPQTGAPQGAGDPANTQGTGQGTSTPQGFDYAGIQDYLENLPGYRFIRDQGIKGITNTLSARGLGGISGPMAKGIARFVTGLADQTYGEQLGRIASAVGTGQNAAAQTGGFGTTAAGGAAGNLIGGANAIAQGITGAANAGAAGQIGAANALGGGLNNVGNAFLTSRILGMYGGGGGALGGQQVVGNPGSFIFG